MPAAVVLLLFVVCVLIAMPISLSLSIACVLPDVFRIPEAADTTRVIGEMFNTLNSFSMLAIPMFILSGIIMSKGDIAKRLFDLFVYLTGKRTAGIPCAIVATSLFYGAMSGSGVTTVAAVGNITLPILFELGYKKKSTSAIVAVSGILGIIISPSIPLIVYGIASGESISSMFKAGIIPGIIIALTIMVFAVFYYKKHGENKEKIAAYVDELHKKGFLPVLKDSLLVILFPVVVLGSIFSGLLSPTGASILSVVYAFLISVFVYKEVPLKDSFKMLIEAVETFAPILFTMAAAVVFSHVLRMLDIPQAFSSFVLANCMNKVVVLLVINLLLLIVGMFMDITPAIVILTPFLLPIAKGFNLSGVHFGVLMVVNLAIGYVTPPIGVNLFVSSALTNVPVMDISKKAVPLIGMLIAVLLLITFVPVLSLLFIA